AADGKITYISPAFGRPWGYAPEAYLGHSAFEHIHPDDAPYVIEAFQKLLQNVGQPEFVQYRARHRDGSWGWSESVGTNLLDEPSVRAIVVNTRDISERKQAERALRASEERFSKIFHTSPVGMGL